MKRWDLQEGVLQQSESGCWVTVTTEATAAAAAAAATAGKLQGGQTDGNWTTSCCYSTVTHEIDSQWLQNKLPSRVSDQPHAGVVTLLSLPP